MEKLEEAYRAAEGKSFYDRPENVVSIKITPFWGYQSIQSRIGTDYLSSTQRSVGTDYPDGFVFETDGAALNRSNSMASGTTRGATVASETTFGKAGSQKAASVFVSPGKSVYIDLASIAIS